MEALHQLVKLFQQAATKITTRPTLSHLPPSRKREKGHNHISRQHFKKHDAHPYRPNIIGSTVRIRTTAGTNAAPRPTRLCNTSKGDTISKGGRISTIPNAELHPSTNAISSKYANAENYIAIAEANSVTQPITGQSQEYRHFIRGDEK